MIWYLGSSEVLWENKNKDRKEGRLMGMVGWSVRMRRQVKQGHQDRPCGETRLKRSKAVGQGISSLRQKQ